MEYDYLIVGTGLFGAVFAHEAKKAGKKCLMIDKREHRGGNVFCKEIEGIQVHFYGPHIFHTNDQDIWDYVNQFVVFNHYTHAPVANYKGQLYSLPFNMNTFYQLWGVKTPKEAHYKIAEQIKGLPFSKASNLEEQALLLVGPDIYEKLIKHYTEKQWGMCAKELPSFIIKRLPVRFTFDNNYFNDKYQGIPEGGYNRLIDGLINSIEVQLGANFFEDRQFFEAIADKIVFTGKIDEFYGFRFGRLDYRGLLFEHQTLAQSNFQGCAIMNYTDAETPYTRVIEHKHFEFGNQEKTCITYEYPLLAGGDIEPYYPINNEKNMITFAQYKNLAKQESRVIFGGRLAEYRYYDMHQVIASALHKSKSALYNLV